MDVTLPVTLSRYVTPRHSLPRSRQVISSSLSSRYVTPCHSLHSLSSLRLRVSTSQSRHVMSRHVTQSVTSRHTVCTVTFQSLSHVTPKPRHTVSVYAPSFLVVTPSSRCPSSLSHTPVTLSRLLVLLSHLLVSLSHPVSRCHTLATLFLFLVTPPCLVMPPCLVVTFLSRGHASLFRCLTSSPRCLTSARRRHVH